MRTLLLLTICALLSLCALAWVPGDVGTPDA